MQKRLQRAKNKIKTAGIAYKVPNEKDIEFRLESVLSTIYLIFNESYSAFEGQNLTRDDLAEEAIRLARVLYSLVQAPAAGGLLSLLLLHHSRSVARCSPKQEFIPLELQNRDLWDKEKNIGRKGAIIDCSKPRKAEKYQIQASISAVHSEASKWSDTDWPQIVMLYNTLYTLDASPVVKLNGLVALAQSGRHEPALSQLELLSDTLTTTNLSTQQCRYILKSLVLQHLRVTYVPFN